MFALQKDLVTERSALSSMFNRWRVNWALLTVSYQYYLTRSILPVLLYQYLNRNTSWKAKFWASAFPPYSMRAVTTIWRGTFSHHQNTFLILSSHTDSIWWCIWYLYWICIDQQKSNSNAVYFNRQYVWGDFFRMTWNIPVSTCITMGHLSSPHQESVFFKIKHGHCLRWREVTEPRISVSLDLKTIFPLHEQLTGAFSWKHTYFQNTLLIGGGFKHPTVIHPNPIWLLTPRCCLLLRSHFSSKSRQTERDKILFGDNVITFIWYKRPVEHLHIWTGTTRTQGHRI